MIQVTRWRPDTCKCVIELEWDDSVSEDVREHTAKTVTACQFHNTGTKAQKYNKVLNENRTKNMAIAKLEELAPTTEKVDGKLKEEPKWEFDENRNLVIRHKLKSLDADLKKDFPNVTIL